MTTIVVAEEHHQIYDYWCDNLMFGGRKILHIDYHCDMRSLMVDRKLQKASYTGTSNPFWWQFDEGSWLAHSVMRGDVSSVVWAHDEHSGRDFDFYSIRYVDDASSFYPLERRRWVNFRYKEVGLMDISSVQKGWDLDIDFDALSNKEFSKKKTDTLVDHVLSFSGKPEFVYLIESPEYSNLLNFNWFLSELKKKYKAKVFFMPRFFNRSVLYCEDRSVWGNEWLRNIFLSLRRKGIY